MLFNSWEFLFFCVLVMPVYFGIRHGAQNWLLLVASYVFYGWWDWRFLGLIFVTTVFDYFIAGAMESATQDRRRKLLLLSLALNLTILGFFKYFNFFVGSAAVALRAFGVEVHPATLTIILPVGISFYTFQEMSYVVDVYRVS